MSTPTHNSENGFTIVELMIATAVLSTILVLVTVVMVNISNLYYKGINQAKVQDNVRSITDELADNIRLSSQSPILSSDTGSHGEKAYCVGALRYTFVTGVQIGHQASGNPSSSPVYSHILWRDSNPTQGGCSLRIHPTSPSDTSTIDLTDPNLSSDDQVNNGTELVADNSRLTEFSMTQSTTSIIRVGVAYGDEDLLCNPSVAISGVNSCDSSAPPMSTITTCDNNTKAPLFCAPNYTINNSATPPALILCKGGKGDQFCSTADLTTTVVQRL